MQFNTPTSKQIEYAKQIAKTLGISLPDDVYRYYSAMKSFLDKANSDEYKKAFFEKQKDEIRKNLSLVELLELLGYEEVKGKSCKTYPQYKASNGEVVTCSIKRTDYPKKSDNYEFYTYFMVKDTSEPPQLEIRNLGKEAKRREFKEGHKGGDIISFMSDRLLDYSYGSIMKMLEAITIDRKNAEKYGFKIGSTAGKDYSLPSASIRRDENYQIWKRGYESETNFFAKANVFSRGLELRGDIQELLDGSNAQNRINRIKLTRPESDHYEDIGAYSISCPTYTIEGGKLKMIGDQRMNLLTQDFFKIVRDNIKKGSYKPQSTYRVDDARLEATIKKLSKMEIPNDLKNDETYGVMSRMLLVKYKDDDGQIKRGFIDLEKRMRKGSQRGISLVGSFPKLETTDQTLLIVENPVLDGASAIKLGYYDKDKTTIAGTLGHPSELFYDTLKTYMKMALQCYNRIVIGFDNDEAGDKFSKDMEAKISGVFKDLLLEKINLSRPELIKSLDDIKVVSNQILKNHASSLDENTTGLLRKFVSFNIERGVPNNPKFKDFNEELVEKVMGSGLLHEGVENTQHLKP
jgi:hypothetical protein